MVVVRTVPAGMTAAATPAAICVGSATAFSGHPGGVDLLGAEEAGGHGGRA